MLRRIHDQAHRADILTALGAILVVAGGTLIIPAMGSLRSAYLQREKSGEGLAFFPLGLALIAGSLAALLGALALLGAGIERRGRGRTLCVGATVLVIAAIVTCFGVFQWVINQSGCIGACG